MTRKVLVVLAAMLVGGSVGSAVGTASVPLIFHRPIVSLGANQSSNWSGYNQGTLEQGGGVMFNSVSATWRVPTATAHAPNEAEYSSTWVGIGGGCVDAACNGGRRGSARRRQHERGARDAQWLSLT